MSWKSFGKSLISHQRYSFCEISRCSLHRNGKGKLTIYIAPYSTSSPLKALRHGSHSYLQITPCMPFLRKRSPDGAIPDWGSIHKIATYYSFIYPECWCRASCWCTIGVIRQPIKRQRQPRPTWSEHSSSVLFRRFRDRLRQTSGENFYWL